MVIVVVRSLIAAIVVALFFMWLSSDALAANAPPRYKHTSERISFQQGAIRRSSQKTNKVVVIVHGGGWRAGTIRDTWQAGIDQYLLRRGYDVINIRYPVMRGDAPRSIDITREWIRWANERYADVTVLGGSAGGYLAIAASDALPDRVVAISPAVNAGADMTQGSLVWPIAWEWGFACTGGDCEDHKLRSVSVPTTIIHARNDRATAYEGSYFFQRDNKRLVSLVTYDGSQHGWSLVWRSNASRITL